MARFVVAGVASLQCHSTRSSTRRRPTAVAAQAASVAVRRQRLTGTRIAHDLAISAVIVSRVLPATL